MAVFDRTGTIVIRPDPGRREVPEWIPFFPNVRAASTSLQGSPAAPSLGVRDPGSSNAMKPKCHSETSLPDPSNTPAPVRHAATHNSRSRVLPPDWLRPAACEQGTMRRGPSLRTRASRRYGPGLRGR